MGVELHHSGCSWVFDTVPEDHGSLIKPGGQLQDLGEVLPVEDIVLEDEGNRGLPYELFPHDEGLGEASGVVLGRIAE